jgi:hypothetical protein
MKSYIRKIDGEWYAFLGDEKDGRIYTPRYGNWWTASWTDEGIKYICPKSASRNAAYQKARRLGKYQGEG